jgi:hypothetical protein
MEQLQEAYVQSVAATAGCLFDPVARDRFGMDVLLVRPNETTKQESSVYAQLKSTTTVKPDSTQPSFGYQFKKRRYLEQLAAPRKYPKAILIVMAICPVQKDWVSNDHDNLRIQHCCYWVSLEGHAIPDGVSSPTVQVPTSNIFDAASLLAILDKTDGGDGPSA